MIGLITVKTRGAKLCLKIPASVVAMKQMCEEGSRFSNRFLLGNFRPSTSLRGGFFVPGGSVFLFCHFLRRIKIAQGLEELFRDRLLLTRG